MIFCLKVWFSKTNSETKDFIEKLFSRTNCSDFFPKNIRLIENCTQNESFLSIGVSFRVWHSFTVFFTATFNFIFILLGIISLCDLWSNIVDNVDLSDAFCQNYRTTGQRWHSVPIRVRRKKRRIYSGCQLYSRYYHISSYSGKYSICIW